jgi:hypothetical protein
MPAGLPFLSWSRTQPVNTGPVVIEFLLLEDGFFFLLEDGNKMIL